jgi:hypothetical protein
MKIQAQSAIRAAAAAQQALQEISKKRTCRNRSPALHFQKIQKVLETLI